MNGNQSEMEQMLKDISILDFTLVDFTEYLDTHPFDKQAIAYFNHYNKIRMDLTKQFSEKFYPLQTSFSSDTTEWSWGLAPLPWRSKYEMSDPAINSLSCKGGKK